MTGDADTGGAAPGQPLLATGRGAARLAAVQALYELDMSQAALDDVLVRFMEDRWMDEGESGDEGAGPAPNSAPMSEDLFARIVRGVHADLPRFDRLIDDALSSEWTVNRLEAVLRSTLRAATFELAAEPGVPPKVIISEYVDVAHAFFAGNEPALVNGVLDTLARVLRAQEMEAASGDRPAETG